MEIIGDNLFLFIFENKQKGYGNITDNNIFLGEPALHGFEPRINALYMD